MSVFLPMVCITLITTSTDSTYNELLKYFAIAIFEIVYCLVCYNTGIVVSAFLGLTSYSILIFLDFCFVWILGLSKSLHFRILGILYRAVWVLLLIFIRKTLSPLKQYLKKGNKQWIKYMWFPAISTAIGIYFIVSVIITSEIRPFYAILSCGVIALDITALFFLMEMLKREDKIQTMTYQLHQKQNQLQAYHDMQSLYERQGKKLHDYKKQLSTVSELIGSGNTAAADRLTKELTESISVEVSEVNTGHPIVNAVLNQEYRIAKSKGIGIIFSVGSAEHLSMAIDRADYN